MKNLLQAYLNSSKHEINQGTIFLSLKGKAEI